MGAKKYCGQCIHLKYEDQNGDGWCELWQESDVNVRDEACVEMVEKTEEENQ